MPLTLEDFFSQGMRVGWEGRSGGEKEGGEWWEHNIYIEAIYKYMRKKDRI